MLAFVHDGERALEVDGNNIVPFLLGHIEHHPVAQDAGNRNHNVQLAEIIHRSLYDIFSAGHGRHRFGAGHRRPAGFTNFVYHLLRYGNVGSRSIHVHAQVAHHHAGALSGHQLRHSPPDAAARSGYDCYLVFQ